MQRKQNQTKHKQRQKLESKPLPDTRRSFHYEDLLYPAPYFLPSIQTSYRHPTGSFTSLLFSIQVIPSQRHPTVSFTSFLLFLHLLQRHPTISFAFLLPSLLSRHKRITTLDTQDPQIKELPPPYKSQNKGHLTPRKQGNQKGFTGRSNP